MRSTLPGPGHKPAGAIQPSAKPGEINGDAVDRFTLGHFAAGVLMGLGRVPMPAVVVAAIGWEFIENPLKAAYPGAFPHASRDSIPNAVVDAAAVLAGYALIRALPPAKGSAP